MKIFISHSMEDRDLLKRLQKILEPHNINLYIAEHYFEISGTITNKIENMIQMSDIAIILLTENGFNSNFVQQEIGYLQSLKKPCIPVVQIGLKNKITGFIFGKDFIEYDPNQQEAALSKIKAYLLKYWQIKQKRLMQKSLEQYRKTESLRIENKRKADNAKIVLGLIAGAIILGIADDK